MRRIIFRGKDLNGTWRYGDLLHNEKDFRKFYEILHWVEEPYKCEVIEDTIGQFTGLKDMNGKYIYEGDIVKWGHTENCHEYPPRISVVKIEPDIRFHCITATEHNFGQSGYVFQYGNFAYKQTEKYLEVIGNIHDNPELLRNEG